MVTIKINNQTVEVPEKSTILEATRIAGMPVPTLCYLKGINEIAACRVCVVEVKGINHLVTSCNNVVQEGMEVFTNTLKVREARRTNVELLLSQHRTNCPTCKRSGNCELQRIANTLNINEYLPYHYEPKMVPWDKNFPLIRDASKCLRCMRCISFCDKVQSLGIWDVANTGSHQDIFVSHDRTIDEADCALCGQCITHCPTAALQSRDDTDKIFGVRGVLNDPEKITVIQVAPAVRAAWGEEFGLDPAIANEQRLVSALKQLGFNYVFDTNFSADLTIMEEGTEFLSRLQEKDAKWPMFTSCCPGWVRFLKSQYPDMVGQLSTAKSPQQMFGAITKTYFAKKLGVDASKISCISVMPCVAKKAECALPNMNDAGAGQDVDFSLTTREICRMIHADQIDVSMLPECEFDSPLGAGTGAAVIFGATGGVMEAALRTCYAVVTGENPAADAFKSVRGMQGWKEVNFDLAGTTVRTAVVSGLGQARALIEALRAGEVAYDFVEVMACPGGCAGGGGQPIHFGCELAEARGQVLYAYDEKNTLRFSHENPEVQALYAEFLGEPCGERSHHLLHTDHTAWEMPQALPRER